MAFDLQDYVTVPERVAQFYEQFPEGRIVSDPPRVITIGDRAFIEVTTRVFRTPDDPTPCQGSAWEPFPGRTPYTKESEMMNAETSAIGRACAAAGIAVRKSIASANEVRNRQEARSAPAAPWIEDLVKRMNDLPASVRSKVKFDFVEEFGKPAALSEDRQVVAEQFVAMQEAMYAEFSESA